METNYSMFGLTAEQTQILFALQRSITVNDIAVEKTKQPLIGANKSARKQLWLDCYDKHIVEYMTNLGISNPTLKGLNLKKMIATADAENKNTVWKYLILLECVLYTPYYSLQKDKNEDEPYKGLKVDKKAKMVFLESIAKQLQIDPKYIATFEKACNKAVKDLSNYTVKIASTAVAGVVLTLIALLTFQYEILAVLAPGLSGAAAVSAGLAALGGGAIAAGGFGMAGGLAVYIGGGALLGLGIGTGAGFSVASLGSNAVLTEAAKLQVVLKEIVLAIQKDTETFQNILGSIEQQIHNLRTEIITLKAEAEQDKKRIKDLERSLSYLEKLIKNLMA